MAELRLLAVHAHADDETITMGGLLATCADRGARTAVICCTDGKMASIVDPDMPEESTRPRLAEIRRGELGAACAILGVSEVHFLDYGDSGMAGEASNLAAGAFWTAGLDEAAGRIVGHLRRFRPHVVVTYDANGAYGHPDHIQAHRATLLAVEAAHLPQLYPEAGAPWRVSKLYYTAFPVSAMRRMRDEAIAAGIEAPFGGADPEELPFLTPDELVTTHVPVREGVLRKREALRAHRSQIGPDWPMLTMSDERAVDSMGTESFQLAISRKPALLPETDVFAGILEEEPAGA